MAKPYAKIVTARGEHTLSHRELDELRMLLSMREAHDITPNAQPPVMESTYENLREFISDNFEKEHGTETLFLSDRPE